MQRSTLRINSCSKLVTCYMLDFGHSSAAYLSIGPSGLARPLRPRPPGRPVGRTHGTWLAASRSHHDRGRWCRRRLACIKPQLSSGMSLDSHWIMCKLTSIPLQRFYSNCDHLYRIQCFTAPPMHAGNPDIDEARESDYTVLIQAIHRTDRSRYNV